VAKPSIIGPVAAGIAIALIFGLSFLFTKDALAVLNPFELLAHRFSLAAVFLGILIGLRVIKVRFSRSLLWDLLPLALFQPILYFIGETYGVQLTSASEAGLLIGLIPVGVCILAPKLLGEKTDARNWFYVWLSVAGVGMIVCAGPDARFGARLTGIAALSLAVVSAALYNIWSRRLFCKYAPVEITTVMMIVGALFFNGYYGMVVRPGAASYFNAFSHPAALIALLYLGLLSSVGAFFLVNYRLHHRFLFESDNRGIRRCGSALARRKFQLAPLGGRLLHCGRSMESESDSVIRIVKIF
jgi:drug/metabolite transporter (DMT)-like permease